MSTRTPEASPYRHHQNHYRYVDPTTGQSHSPESDVGYGTSFGSQDFNGHNIDIDSISNLLVRYTSYMKLIRYHPTMVNHSLFLCHFHLNSNLLVIYTS